jgi:hypothetical protein
VSNYRRRNRLRSQAQQAKRIIISEQGILPSWDKIVRLTAQYWKVPISAVNREMMIATIRHNYTNYDKKLQEFKTGRTQKHSTVFYEASEILKEKANRLASQLCDRAEAEKQRKTEAESCPALPP